MSSKEQCYQKNRYLIKCGSRSIELIDLWSTTGPYNLDDSFTFSFQFIGTSVYQKETYGMNSFHQQKIYTDYFSVEEVIRQKSGTCYHSKQSYFQFGGTHQMDTEELCPLKPLLKDLIALTFAHALPIIAKANSCGCEKKATCVHWYPLLYSVKLL